MEASGGWFRHGVFERHARNYFVNLRHAGSEHGEPQGSDHAGSEKVLGVGDVTNAGLSRISWPVGTGGSGGFVCVGESCSGIPSAPVLAQVDGMLSVDVSESFDGKFREGMSVGEHVDFGLQKKRELPSGNGTGRRCCLWRGPASSDKSGEGSLVHGDCERFYGYGGTIPCPRDLVHLEAFKQKCPLSEPYVLHNGKEIGVTTDSGRFVLGGFVEDIINTFKSGYSWGGDFNKDDLAVQIGVRCYISKVPNLRGTYKNLCKDLDQMAEALIPHFRGVHGNNIAFIEHLYETMKNPPSLSSSTQERQRYLKFLKSHPALADPLSVSSLLVGIAQTYKSMGLSDKKAFEAAISIINLHNSPDWRDKVKSDLLWSQVYTEKQRKSIKKKQKERYACTAISLSIFLRHFIIHSPEYTLVGGVQLMKTIDEVDYLVADFFDNFIAELFKVLVYEFDMDKDILKSVWKMYDVGEDRKEIIKRIWKCETELDFMLKTQEVTLTQSHVEASASGQAMAD